MTDRSVGLDLGLRLKRLGYRRQPQSLNVARSQQPIIASQRMTAPTHLSAYRWHARENDSCCDHDPKPATAFAKRLYARRLSADVSLGNTSHCLAGPWPVVPVPGVAGPAGPVPLGLVPVLPGCRAIRRLLRPSCCCARALCRAARRFACR
jgi:hypothetical protein